METVCQLSYPLKSENASPFGTRTVYLAWPVSCAEVALLPRTASTERASDSTTITTAGILLLFIASPRCLLVASMGLTVRRSLARMAGRVKHYGTVTGRRRLCFSISATRSRRRSVGLSVHELGAVLGSTAQDEPGVQRAGMRVPPFAGGIDTT